MTKGNTPATENTRRFAGELHVRSAHAKPSTSATTQASRGRGGVDRAPASRRQNTDVQTNFSMSNYRGELLEVAGVALASPGTGTNRVTQYHERFRYFDFLLEDEDRRAPEVDDVWIRHERRRREMIRITNVSHTGIINAVYIYLGGAEFSRRRTGQHVTLRISDFYKDDLSLTYVTSLPPGVF